jgi:hypothetical protein
MLIHRYLVTSNLYIYCIKMTFIFAVSGKGVGSRGRGAVLGAALGASIGVPAGMLQDYLITMLPEDQQRQRQLRVQQTESIIAGEGGRWSRLQKYFISFDPLCFCISKPFLSVLLLIAFYPFSLQSH